MRFFLRSSQTHLRKLSLPSWVLKSRLVPDFAPQPSSSSSSSYTLSRQLSSVSRRFISDFTSRPVSKSPYNQQTNVFDCFHLLALAKRGACELQENSTQSIFYGLDDIDKASLIIIVEGEMDKLAMEEAGFQNCVSVPSGSPGSVSKKTPPESKDTKYNYLWNCNEYVEKASHIVIATDGDGPGQALAEEVAQRVGKERCWLVKWPKKSQDEHCKDANEVLISMGPDALYEAVKDAEPYPIQGVVCFKDFFDEIDAYYDQID